MKVIKPGYYEFVSEPDCTSGYCMIAVYKDFYDKHGYMDDRGKEDAVLIPLNFDNLSEGIYEFDRIGTRDDVRALLNPLGWVEKAL
jgi:hypothetical protein